MSESAPGTATTPKPRRLLKWIARILLAIVGICVLVLVIAGVLLATGAPQRRLLEGELGKALKADVKADGISIVNPFRIANLKAFDKTPGADPQTPMIDLAGLKAAYVLFPKDAHHVTSLTIDKLDINIDRSRVPAAAPAAPTPTAAPSEPPAKPAPAPPAPKQKGLEDDIARRMIDFTWKLLPKTVDLAALKVASTLPYVGLSLDGLTAKATIESKRDYTVQVKGSGMNGFFWAGGPAAKRDLKDSAIDLTYESGKKRDVIEPFKVALPGLLDIDGGVLVKEDDGKTVVNIHFEKGLAQNVDMSQSATGTIPFPFRFGKLDLSGTAIRGFGKSKGVTINASFEGTNISVVGEDLALGPKDHEYYEGNLALLGKGGPGEQLKLDLEAILNRGQKLAASFEGSELLTTKAHIGMENWSRSDLIAALPKDAQAALGVLPGLQTLSSSIDLQLEKSLAYTLQVRLTPQWLGPDGQPAEIALAFESKEPLLRVLFEKGIEGTLHTQVRDQVVDGTVRIAKNRVSKAYEFSGKATLQQWDPRTWTNVLLSTNILDALDVRLDGTVEGTVSAGAQSITAQLKGLELAALSQTLPLLGLAGKADTDVTFKRQGASLQDVELDVAVNGPLSIATTAIKALLASTAAKVAGQESNEGALKTLLEKEGPCALDGAKIHVAIAAGKLEGRVVLMSGKVEHTIVLHAELGTLGDGIKMLQ